MQKFNDKIHYVKLPLPIVQPCTYFLLILLFIRKSKNGRIVRAILYHI